MNPLHPSIAHLPRPARIARLPIDARGFPVPAFVAHVDGIPDHRIIDGRRFEPAVRQHRCWICGEPLGRYLASVLGPMCVVTRTVSEPPSHRECACYAVQACPFLSRPHMLRRETQLPEEVTDAAGVPLKRNPGCVAVWIAREVRPFAAPDGGVLFRVGDPTAVEWYAEGRAATLAEVQASLASGLPRLVEMAEAEGRHATRRLAQQVTNAQQYLPKEIGISLPAEKDQDVTRAS